DEPTGNLDSHTSEEIMALFAQLNRDGITILLVTHEADIAAHAKRQVRFLDGLIVSDITTPAGALAQC
ncbi:MAG TPA: macrolide ABC transporter ATP-binding protein, partial [Accumulibacter sp.]|nr:macrolide ABC transporter ATP-binding protein [Accumulibacter sp.]